MRLLLLLVLFSLHGRLAKSEEGRIGDKPNAFISFNEKLNPGTLITIFFKYTCEKSIIVGFSPEEEIMKDKTVPTYLKMSCKDPRIDIYHKNKKTDWDWFWFKEYKRKENTLWRLDLYTLEENKLRVFLQGKPTGTDKMIPELEKVHSIYVFSEDGEDLDADDVYMSYKFATPKISTSNIISEIALQPILTNSAIYLSVFLADETQLTITSGNDNLWKVKIERDNKDYSIKFKFIMEDYPQKNDGKMTVTNTECYPGPKQEIGALVHLKLDRPSSNKLQLRIFYVTSPLGIKCTLDLSNEAQQILDGSSLKMEKPEGAVLYNFVQKGPRS